MYMLFFLLPNINITIYKQIDCIITETIPEIFISNSLSHYLFEIKNKIKKYENEWNEYKKYTNPYEFINTIIPNKNKCVAKYKPLSRSYFKMIEIIHFLIYGGDAFIENETPIRTFHLAEGPGGFIEAIVNTRKNSDDLYYGMTILDDSENNKMYCFPESNIQENTGRTHMNVPGWKKSDHFLKSHPNVVIETGSDKTGNILSMENFLYCREKYGGTMDLITGDGGFDFSIDFNNQEMNIAGLLFAQLCYALCLQKQGGVFILKIFDCFMEHTIDILYILSAFYEKVYITKPQTSRYANSEKYLICKNFLVKNDAAVFPFLKNAFQKMLDSMGQPQYIFRFLKIPVSTFFLYRIEEYNSIFGQQQIENIYQTIVLIENKYKNGSEELPSNHKSPSEQTTYKKNTKSICDIETSLTEKQLLLQKTRYIGGENTPRHVTMTHQNSSKIENLVKINIQKCVQWCVKYNVNYNSD